MSYMNRTSMLDEMLDRMSHHESNTTFDLPKNEHGKQVQHHDGPVRVHDKVVKSPVDINTLPSGKHRLAK